VLLGTALAATVTGSASGVVSGRYALGDSVMLGAATRLHHGGYAVNAVESRQVADGVAVLRRLRADGRLPGVVVVGLGTNGTFSSLQCRAMHRIVGPYRHLFVVTGHAPRPWVQHNNYVIRNCARQYSNTVLIDWARTSVSHPSWFYSDRIHLTPRGAYWYTRLVTRTVHARS